MHRSKSLEESKHIFFLRKWKLKMIGSKILYSEIDQQGKSYLSLSKCLYSIAKKVSYTVLNNTYNILKCFILPTNYFTLLMVGNLLSLTQQYQSQTF